MNPNPNPFEKIVLPEEHQSELESIGRAVQERQVDYTNQGIIKEKRDILKEVLSQRISPSPALSSAAKNAESQVSSHSEESERIALMEKSQKLQELVNIAATKGPVEASLIAQKIGDPWLEDQFHDTLISFHDELVKRKKLKEE